MLYYDDAIVHARRTGSSTDPFVEVNDVLTLDNNGKVILTEIPDKFTKVKVTGDNRVWYEIDEGSPDINQYIVDYKNKIVTFNIGNIGKQLSFDYKGTGLTYIPTSMVYTVENNGDITETLKQLTDTTTQAREDARTTVDEFTHMGNYDSTTQYHKGNMVMHEGMSYISLGETLGNPPTDTNYWEKLTAFRNMGAYSSTETYQVGDFVNDSVNEELFMSLIDNNLGNALTDATSWKKMITVKQALADVRQATTDAQSATSAAQTATSEANTATTNANTAATSANDAASYANTQGDYAKSQGDNLGHKGDYDPLVAYKDGNVVTYNGQNYICIQDTTAGTDPTNGTYWTVISHQATINDQSWTATEGQTVFILTNGTYEVGKDYIEVWVGGVPQVSGTGYTETDSTTITLSEGVSAGTVVYAKWFEGAISITKGHNTTHEVGGSDALDVTKLNNYSTAVKDRLDGHDSQLAQKVNKDVIFINVKDYGVVGDGVADDTIALQDMFDNLKTLNMKDYGTYQTIYFVRIYFPSGTYKISNHLVIADESVDTGCQLTIEGDGLETTSIVGSGDYADIATMHDIFVIKATGGNIRGVTIRDMMIRKGRVLVNTFGLAYSTVKNCWLADWMDEAIKTNSTGNLIFRHNIFTYGDRNTTKETWAMKIGESTMTNNVIIEGNIFAENVTYGIYAASGGSSSIIANNQFVGPYSDNKRIQLGGGCDRWVITGNIISGYDNEYAIILDGSNCIVSNNVITGGIRSQKPGNLIQGNYLKTVNNISIRLTYNVTGSLICNNKVDCASGGAGIFGDQSSLKNNLVRSNVINGDITPDDTILESSDGTKWKVTIDNTGNLTTAIL